MNRKNKIMESGEQGMHLILMYNICSYNDYLVFSWTKNDMQENFLIYCMLFLKISIFVYVRSEIAL